MIRVREFEKEKDSKTVEELEHRCDVGPSVDVCGTKKANEKKKKKKKKSLSLFVELLGDPLSRVHHCPDHIMLVAELGEKKEMVGVIRACVKMVTRGKDSVYVKVAYILGLRVSPHHRRLGIGTKLVEGAEWWSAARGAEYAYMATDGANAASIKLFTERLAYARFRFPAILAHPVHAHRLPLSSSDTVLHLPPRAAAALYERIFPPSAVEFLPADFPALLAHPLTIGTFLAVPSSSSSAAGAAAGEVPATSFAVMSLWDSTQVLRLRVAGAPAAARAALAVLRALDGGAPWLRVPSVRDVFRPFGVYLMYGLHMSGREGPRLMRQLCRVAHNAAVGDGDCAAVVAEVGPGDPVRAAVPHWKRFSYDEDVWCMKRLSGHVDAVGDGDDWLAAQPATQVIFVDPREF